MLFRQCTFYELVPDFEISADDLELMASQEPARMCQYQELAHLGFDYPFKQYPRRVYEMDSGQVLYLKLTRHERVLPAQVVRLYTEQRIDALEKKQGERASRKQQQEIQLAVRQELTSNAQQKAGIIQVIIDLSTRGMWIDQAADKKLDMVIELMGRKLDKPFGVRLTVPENMQQRLKTWALDPALLPEGLHLGESIRLQSNDGDTTSTVNAKHEMISEEEWARIIADRAVVELALETQDLQFTLSERDRMKAIKPLTSMAEVDPESAGGRDDAFYTELWETVSYLRAARSAVAVTR